MAHQLFAVYAKHETHGDEVCFIVVAENLDRMGWPLLAKYGKVFSENYEPLRVIPLGYAPGRRSGFIDVFGPRRSLPKAVHS